MLGYLSTHLPFYHLEIGWSTENHVMAFKTQNVKEAMEWWQMPPTMQIVHLSLHDSYNSWLESRNSLPFATDDVPVAMFLLQKFNNGKSDVCIGTRIS